MRKSYNLLLLGIIVLLISVNFVFLHKRNSDQHEIEYMESLILNLKYTNEELKEIVSASYKYEHGAIFSLPPFERGEQNGKGFKVYFRFKNITCSPCLERHISFINSIKADVMNKENITFLGDFLSENEIDLFKSRNALSNKVVSMKSTGLLIDNLNKPYYIVTNKDDEVVNIFFPVVDWPDVTQGFLRYYGVDN